MSVTSGTVSTSGSPGCTVLRDYMNVVLVDLLSVGGFKVYFVHLREVSVL